jgi:anti-sigma factor RsiW
MTHLDFDHLNDFLDDRLAPPDREAAQSHLATCSQCAGALAHLESISARARALPEEIQPPQELWNAVRQQIEPASRSRRWSAWQLAAAAVLLVGLSSVITARIVRRPETIVVRHATTAVTPAAVTLRAPARAVDADYAAIVHQLNQTLAERRSQLDPATVAKVEASLRVIDTALNEARAALAADPANLTLLDLFAATYERKVELLRRANELPSTT